MTFVERASGFAAEVTVRRTDSEETVDGKSIMQMLMLAGTCGTEIEIAADGADEVARNAMEQAGGIGVLANVVGGSRPGKTVVDLPLEEWQHLLALNLTSIFLLCKAVVPHMAKAGRGSIVNVSSCYAVTGRRGMGLYDATKAALLSLTRTLAAEESAHGVRVNAVCPGSTLTEFHLQRAQAAGTAVEVLKTQRQTTSMLGRWAEPQEIAWPVLWLASDEASYITGTTLMVDGGLHAQ